MANKTVPKYFRKAYQDFSGGLNDFDSPLIVKQNQFTTLNNALVNSNGLLEKAKGYSVDGSPFPDDVDSFIRMLVNYKRGTSVDKLVCAALDEGNTNTTYKVDIKETSGDGTYAYIAHTAGTNASFTTANTAVTGVGTTWTSHLKAGDKIKASAHADSAYTEIASVTNDTNLVLVAGGYLGATAATVAYKARKILNKDFIPSAIVFNNNLIITNGSDTPLTYNNTTLNNITDTDAPKGKFIEAHKSRVFIAGTSGGPSSIFWSAVNDETVWDATSVEIVFANDNGNICGLKSFSDSLIVLKDNGNIYQVVGSFDQDAVGEPDYIRRIDTPSNIGTIAGFTAVVHDNNKLHFLAETGVYSLDSRMFLEKTSWDVQTTVDDIILRSGTVSAKSVIYDSQTQWNTGSYSSPVSTRASSTGTLSRINDLVTHTDATKANNLCAIKTASNGDIHYVYVGTDGKTVKHVSRTIANVSVSTDVVTAANSITDLSLDLNSAGDLILVYYTSASDLYQAEKLSAGSWPAPTLIRNTGFTALACAVRYGALTTTNIFVSCSLTDGSSSVFFIDRRIAGTWAGARIFNNATGSDLLRTGSAVKLDIVLKNSDDNFAISFILGTATLETWAWASGSYNYVTANYSTAITANAYSKTQWVKNSTNERIITFSDGATIKSRNIDASTSATLDASFGNHVGVYLNSSNQYSYMRFDASGTETLVYANTTAVANSTTGIYSTASLYPGRGFDSNGTVYCSIYFGANANEIIVRRIAAIGVWTGPEQSDSTLSVWGTYDVVGEVSNSDTILHQVALNTVSPPTAYNTITSGSLVSSDSTQIFFRVKITFTMGSFSTPEVGSVTLNYTGTGVGPTLPCGVVFDNEYYISHGLSGDANNDSVLLYDRANAWSIQQYPVIFMARYRGSLYGGSATNGKVYKLLQAYRYNASAYTLTATTKDDLLGSIELEKEVYKVYVIYKIQSSGTFDFSYRVNNFATVGGSSWTTTTIDQTTAGIAEIPGISGILKSIQFKIESAGLDAQLGIVGWVILYDYVNTR